jgi:hypothetical protein
MSNNNQKHTINHSNEPREFAVDAELFSEDREIFSPFDEVVSPVGFGYFFDDVQMLPRNKYKIAQCYSKNPGVDNLKA